MPLDHLTHPQRQADGNNGRQSLRHSGNRQADGNHEQFQWIAALQQTCQEDYSADGESRPAKGFSQLIKSFLQGGFFFNNRLEHRGDHTQLGVHARAGYHAGAAPISDNRSHECGIPAVAQRRAGVENELSILLHWH